ncbi:hypothetical protein H5410_006416 [Solanum commersonii]|uniref:Uncharacterized protein n=1 Tax=Solanum commersonii TaxID=4109 RepID=A0A9J6A937_SOLCO|nr:hypothetical protein H5410_006416 [Solanum commersonii]
MEKLFCSSINLVRNEGCTDYDSDDIHWPVLVKNVVNNFKLENLIPTDILSTCGVPDQREVSQSCAIVVVITYYSLQLPKTVAINANTKFILASHDEASMTLVYKELVSTTPYM